MSRAMSTPGTDASLQASATRPPVRAAVIGAGLMGRRHGQAYRSLSGVELVGFVDRNKAVQAATRQAFGLPCHADSESLFAAGPLDAVSICLPDDQHLEVSLAALGRGLAVLVEKPLATDPKEAERI